MRASSQSLLRFLSFFLTLATLVPLFPTTADALDLCRAGCYRQARRCIGSEARAELLGCKFDCLIGSDPREIPACLETCLADFREERSVCREERETCTALCDDVEEHPEIDRECVQACGEDLSLCSQDVIADGRECVLDCTEVPTGEFVGCVRGCVATARESAGACAGDFRGCLGDCGLGERAAQ